VIAWLHDYWAGLADAYIARAPKLRTPALREYVSRLPLHRQGTNLDVD